MDEKEATAAMLERLKLSGLDAQDAKKLNIRPYSTAAAAELGLSVTLGGFKLPYFEVDGRTNCYFRYRITEPATGFRSLTKQPKYLQQPKTSPSIYLPPISGVNWAKELSTPDAIIITEGELKAAAATKRGYPAIGLGGVWSFRCTREGHKLLPALASVAWNDKPVCIVYDSDAVSNPEVIKAENALAEQLTLRGALVSIVRLPPGPKGEKVGLDDWLVAHTDKEEVAALLDSAPTYLKCKELHRLNEEVIYVRDPGFVCRLDTFQTIAVEAFKAHQYATRTYTVKEDKADGSTKLVEKSAAYEWVKWPARAAVEKITYAPGQPILAGNAVNTWRGWGCEPIKGDVTPWKKLLDHLFTRDRIARNYFEQWCAYPLQYPGTKMFVACVMWSRVHGIGKSTIGYSLKHIYGENAAEIDETDLQNAKSDTSWAKDKQFVFGDEMNSHDKRGSANLLKNMITRQEVRIKIKYVPIYTLKDCINYYFTSQKCDAFFLDDGDRRFFIHEPRTEEKLEQEFYTDYYRWLQNGGASHLFHHLLNLDLTGFDPHAPALSTSSKQAMIAAGQSALGSWCRELRDNPDNILRIGDVVNKWTLATTEDLLNLYDPTRRTGVTVVTMGKMLAEAGLKFVSPNQIQLNDGRRQRLWVVRHRISCAKPKAAWLANIYDQEHLHS